MSESLVDWTVVHASSAGESLLTLEASGGQVRNLLQVLAVNLSVLGKGEVDLLVFRTLSDAHELVLGVEDRDTVLEVLSAEDSLLQLVLELLLDHGDLSLRSQVLHLGSLGVHLLLDLLVEGSAELALFSLDITRLSVLVDHVVLAVEDTLIEALVEEVSVLGLVGNRLLGEDSSHGNEGISGIDLDILLVGRHWEQFGTILNEDQASSLSAILLVEVVLSVQVEPELLTVQLRLDHAETVRWLLLHDHVLLLTLLSESGVDELSRRVDEQAFSWSNSLADGEWSDTLNKGLVIPDRVAGQIVLELLWDGLEQPSAEGSVAWQLSLVQVGHVGGFLILGEDEGTVRHEEASNILVRSGRVSLLVEDLEAILLGSSSTVGVGLGLSALAWVDSQLAVFSAFVDAESLVVVVSILGGNWLLDVLEAVELHQLLPVVLPPSVLGALRIQVGVDETEQGLQLVGLLDVLGGKEDLGLVTVRQHDEVLVSAEGSSGPAIQSVGPLEGLSSLSGLLVSHGQDSAGNLLHQLLLGSSSALGILEPLSGVALNLMSVAVSDRERGEEDWLDIPVGELLVGSSQLVQLLSGLLLLLDATSVHVDILLVLLVHLSG